VGGGGGARGRGGRNPKENEKSEKGPDPLRKKENDSLKNGGNFGQDTERGKRGTGKKPSKKSGQAKNGRLEGGKKCPPIGRTADRGREKNDYLVRP